MIGRSVLIGLLVGLLLVVVAALLVLWFYAGPRVLPEGWPALFRSALLVLDGLLVVIVLALVGSLAAAKTGASDAGQGFRAGAVSGLVVGVLFYALLLAPTAAVAASNQLWTFEPTSQQLYPPDSLTFGFIHQVTRAMQVRLDVCLAVGGLLGGLEGALVGLLRPYRAPAQPILLDVIDAPQGRRRWFSNHEVAKAGVLAGLVGGFVIWLSITAVFYGNLKVEWPALQAVIRERTDLVTRALFADTLIDLLVPLFILAVLGTGALAVLLLRDPPRRHLSRFVAVLIAGLVAAVLVFLALLPVAFFGLAQARYGAAFLLQSAQSVDPRGEFFVNPDALRFLQELVRSPHTLAPFYYLLSIVLFAVVLIVVLFWLAPQAVFYGLTLPLVFRRPVDRAARIARAVNGQPSSFLPRLYGLYAGDAKAIRVLPHLVFLVKDRAAAQVVAAYYALSARPADVERAVSVIRQTVASQESWRWRVEIGELHRVLAEGMAALTLAQITAIRPLPQGATSSLPVLLRRSCEGVGQVLAELKKVERVDDLGTKLIFLNSAQAALMELHRAMEQESRASDSSRTPFPEAGVLHSLLDSWQRLVVVATKELQGRAILQATLLAHRTSFAPRVRQCIVITNEGLNVAQHVRLRVADGEGYRVAEGAEQQVDILSPQESREMEFWLLPDAPRRLRVAWQLTFDDAVDTGRQVEFADAMELVQEQTERPFQRIFPIPYVTGTPLRSGEVFVGRQDVFDFVREHLLGAYQNNVIVLHGQRRTGKTSILYRLQELLADTHVAVLVDMQGQAARGMADFLYALSDDIVYSLGNRGIAVDLPARSEYERAPEFTFRSRFVRSVVEGLDGQNASEQNRAGSRNLLLMFDEFEELQKRVEEGRLEPEIFSYFRNLMQHEPRLDFIFSGTHKLEELGAEYWSMLFNIAAYKRITFLDSDEVCRLATEPVESYGLEYDPLALGRIIQVTAGHPYFAQVVCHEMVVFHNETERSYLTVTCVDEVLERIIERGEAHFRYIWAGTTADEQQAMLALADLLPDADAMATTAQIAEGLACKGYSLSGEALARALTHLQTKDILTRSGPHSSLVRFKIDLIRRWIMATRPAPWGGAA
jgi:hypothetical protein